MVGRGELTDAAWARIAPLLPENGKRGGQWVAQRPVINGILWRLRTGAPWRGYPLGRMPERYGPWQTCYDRFVHWRRDAGALWAVWDRLLAQVQTKSDAIGEIVWEVSVDSTVTRAHQHAAGARRKPSRADEKRGYGTRRTRRSGGAEAG